MKFWFRTRPKSRAAYNYYVWESGAYVHFDGGEFESDTEAAGAAKRISTTDEVLVRPATLDAPHLHVIREDGIHILTLEIPEQKQRPDALAA